MVPSNDEKIESLPHQVICVLADEVCASDHTRQLHTRVDAAEYVRTRYTLHVIFGAQNSQLFHHLK